MSISIVQTSGDGGYVSGSSRGIAFPSNNTFGNALVVTGWGNGSNLSVSDTAGNTGWTLLASQSTNGADTLVVFVCYNCLSGANTVTLSQSGGTAICFLSLSEISGVVTNDQLTSNHQTSVGTTLTTPSITTTQAASIVIAAIQSGSAQGTILSPFISLGAATNTQYGCVGYQIESSNGTYSAQATVANGVDCGSIVFNLCAAIPTYSISGNAGIGSANVNYSGSASGNVTADGSGNYTISGLRDGTYTITPSLVGYTFSPTNQSKIISGSSISGVNFTAILNPAIQVVQTTGNGGFASASSQSKAFVSNNTLGDVLVAAGWGNSSNGAFTLTDTQGNAWVQLAIQPTNGSYLLTAYICYSCKSGANTVTLAQVGATAICLQSITELFGVNTLDVLETQSQTSAGTTLTLAPLITSQPDAIIITAIQSGAAQATILSPFAALSVAPNSQYGCVGYEIVSSIGSYSPQATVSNGQTCGSILFDLYASYSISGNVGVANATISYSGSVSGSTSSDVSGNYTISLLPVGMFTITPSLAGYTFSPPSQTKSISGSITGVNFTAIPVPVIFSISGGTGVLGVTVNWIGLPNGFELEDGSGVIVLEDASSILLLENSTPGSGSVISDSFTNYTIINLPNGTYILTPILAPHVFTPTNATVVLAGANQTNVNFSTPGGAVAGAQGSITLLERPLSGVTVSWTGPDVGSTVTDVFGSWATGEVLQNGFYLFTPSLAGYSFNPPVVYLAIIAQEVLEVNFFAGPSFTTRQFLSPEMHISYAGTPGNVQISMNNPDNQTGTNVAQTLNENLPLLVIPPFAGRSGEIRGRFDQFNVINNPA